MLRKAIHADPLKLLFYCPDSVQKYMMKVPRIALAGFPDVIMHATESAVKNHPHYRAAKAGDIKAAEKLVADVIDDEAVGRIKALLRDDTYQLIPIHALEAEGVNEIPAALAKRLAQDLNVRVNDEIVQINTVGHTGSDGFHRLANQAAFTGNIAPGRYLVIDDFVGQGGTLANLIGYVHSQGGVVVGATVLTGKPYSATISSNIDALARLRDKHGQALENWWKENFGFDFDCLTRSEARYLEKTADADAIRDRIAQAGP